MQLFKTNLNNRPKHMGRNGGILRFDSTECLLFAVDQNDSSFKMVAMVSMVKNLLHRRTGKLARVYVHFFAVSVACTKLVSWAPVHAGV